MPTYQAPPSPTYIANITSQYSQASIQAAASWSRQLEMKIVITVTKRKYESVKAIQVTKIISTATIKHVQKEV